MAAPAQVIQGLRPFKWRGLTVFIESAPVDFAHGLAERKYPYINAAGHDWTGMDPLKVRVRMFFLETIDPGAFTKKWTVWRKALFDGTSGPLEHPVLGKFQARVEGGSIAFAAQTTAGIIVDCSFTETVDNIDKPNKFTDPQPSVTEAAKSAQVAADAYKIPWPSQKLDTDLFEAVKALQTGTQVTFAGYANQIAGNIEKMIADVEALSDPRSYPAYDNLIHTWDLVRDAANKASKDLRSTGSKYTQNDTTIATFAADVGNTEEEIAQLNLRLLRSPVIPAGTAVTYYTGK
jgi:prophage DNA circulation protein